MWNVKTGLRRLFDEHPSHFDVRSFVVVNDSCDYVGLIWSKFDVKSSNK